MTREMQSRGISFGSVLWPRCQSLSTISKTPYSYRSPTCNREGWVAIKNIVYVSNGIGRVLYIFAERFYSVTYFVQFF